MMTRPLLAAPTHPALSPSTSPVRHALSVLLHKASELLQQLAQSLATAPPKPSRKASAPALEFHAEAGAPEGALYIDGQLVAHLAGVRRL